MIALGNNIYRTLDDKFYLGTQQIGKVYLGETLIYPEEKIVIGGVDIDTGYRDIKGNMFDLGITANQYTDFELCMNIPTSFNPSRDSWWIFGTYPRTSGGFLNGCYTIKKDSNGINIKGDDTTFRGAVLNPTANFYLMNGSAAYRFGYAGADGAANSYDLSRSHLSPTNDGRYFISLEGDKLRLGHKYGKFYWEQRKIESANKGNTIDVAKCDAEIAAINDSAAVVTVTRQNLSGNTNNLWYNCINIYTTTPNADRTNVSDYDDTGYNYFGYPNSATLIYLLVIQKDANNNIVHKYLYTQSKKGEITVSRPYTQGNVEAEYYCANIPILRKYTWDSTLNDGIGGFDIQQAEIIYPFKYCKPSIGF